MAEHVRRRGSKQKRGSVGRMLDRLTGGLILIAVCLVAISLGYLAGVGAARWLGSSLGGGPEVEEVLVGSPAPQDVAAVPVAEAPPPAAPEPAEPMAPMAPAPGTQGPEPVEDTAPEPAPAAAAPPPAAEAEAPGGGALFRVRLGPYESEDGAEAVEAALIDRGFEAWAHCDAQCVVQVGAFSTRERADAVVDQLQRIGYEAWVQR